jgi:hypothetical protein
MEIVWIFGLIFNKKPSQLLFLSFFLLIKLCSKPFAIFLKKITSKIQRYEGATTSILALPRGLSTEQWLRMLLCHGDVKAGAAPLTTKALCFKPRNLWERPIDR